MGHALVITSMNIHMNKLDRPEETCSKLEQEQGNLNDFLLTRQNSPQLENNKCKNNNNYNPLQTETNNNIVIDKNILKFIANLGTSLAVYILLYMS